MSGSSKKKSGGKKSGPTKGGSNFSNANSSISSNGNEHKNDSNPLIRRTTDHTINPRNILTGFYQKNGKRVQHIVHDGALQMPNGALNVIETATTNLADGTPVQSNPQYNLPGLDSIVRPCLDPKLETIVVTELVMEKVQIRQQQPSAFVDIASLTGVPEGGGVQPVGPPTVKIIKTSRSMAKNRRIRRSVRQTEITAERIRGGGLILNSEGQEPQQQDPGMAGNADTGQVTVASVDPENVVQISHASSDQTTHLSQIENTDFTNDVATTMQSPVVGNPNMTKFQSNREHRTSASDTSVANKVCSTPGTTESGINDLKQAHHASGNIIANCYTKSPITDVQNSVCPDTKNTLGNTDIQKDYFKTKTAVQKTEPTVPLSVNTSQSYIKSVSNESGGEMTSLAPLKKHETRLQQTISLETSTSKNTSSSVEAATLTGDCKEMGGKKISKAQSSLQSQNVVERGEADTEPLTSFASIDDVSGSPSATMIMNPAIIRTASSITKNIVESLSTNNPASVESFERLPGRNVAPPTTPSIPAVTSSTPVVGATLAQVEQEKKAMEELPEAKVLKSKPAPQWEQHKPGQNDETITPGNQLPPKPDWYKKDAINDIERTMLPEWFDTSSYHRTSETYVTTREKIIEMSEDLNNRNVTNIMIRRSILGDAGSLQRLRNFLVSWGIINRDGINDSASTTASLRPDLKKVTKFTDRMRDDLILAVTEQATKKRKLASTSSLNNSSSLDWEDIACQVGYGLSADSCLNNFMTSLPEKESSRGIGCSEDSSILLDKVTREGMESSQRYGISQEDFIKNFLENSNPECTKKILDTAIEATNFNPLETRDGVFLGVHLTQVIDNARGHEVDLALRLSKLLEARMQKLENRMSLLDDIEGILEAEKVALEMERRDLYTARCRHWFGGV